MAVILFDILREDKSHLLPTHRQNILRRYHILPKQQDYSNIKRGCLPKGKQPLDIYFRELITPKYSNEELHRQTMIRPTYEA